MRVVVAEDEPAIREALIVLLDGEPSCTVVGVAVDADEALDRVAEHDPDVVLADVKMPRGGGIRLAEELRMRGARTRVVVLTAYADRDTVTRMLQAGVAGYLVKGAASAEVVDAVCRAARGQASLAIDTLSTLVDELSGSIAEQRRVEQLRRHSDERTAQLLEHAPDGVVVVDERGAIVVVNAQAERLFGYHRSELVGRPLEVLVPDRFADRHVEQRAGYLSQPATRTMGSGLELTGRRKDGSEFPIDISLASVKEDHGRLVTAFIRDVTERRAEEAVRRRQAERQAVARHFVSISEEERRRIAADIHDDSIQVMAAASLRLQIARRRVRDPEGQETLDQLGDMLDLAIERLRNLLFELRPPALERDGLVPAIEQYVRETSGALACEVTGGIAHDPPSEVRVILYRLAQEALTNVRKHARASAVTVLVGEQDGGVHLRIVDDGVGFDLAGSSSAPGHLGLVSMRERAELAGGWFRIESAPGRGTSVECWVPTSERVRVTA